MNLVNKIVNINQIYHSSMTSKRVSTSTYSPRPKTSKRPYEASHWSPGWDKNDNNNLMSNSSFMKYRNESGIVLQDKFSAKDENKKAQMKKTKTQQFNAKLPTYDPKNANKSQIVFGDQKQDFSKKSSGTTNTRVPPGGRSQIIFG